jgi:hypothetical protein
LSLLRKRAIQRWSALVSQRRYRLSENMGMRAVLGENAWNEFVSYTNARWKPQFISSFVGARLAYSGTADGCACPALFHVAQQNGAIASADLVRQQ